jgi:hypothetical protein
MPTAKAQQERSVAGRGEFCEQSHAPRLQVARTGVWPVRATHVPARRSRRCKKYPPQGELRAGRRKVHDSDGDTALTSVKEEVFPILSRTFGNRVELLLRDEVNRRSY